MTGKRLAAEQHALDCKLDEAMEGEWRLLASAWHMPDGDWLSERMHANSSWKLSQVSIAQERIEFTVGMLWKKKHCASLFSFHVDILQIVCSAEGIFFKSGLKYYNAVRRHILW